MLPPNDGLLPPNERKMLVVASIYNVCQRKLWTIGCLSTMLNGRGRDAGVRAVG
jgi:hypothetical protein